MNIFTQIPGQIRRTLNELKDRIVSDYESSGYAKCCAEYQIAGETDFHYVVYFKVWSREKGCEIHNSQRVEIRKNDLSVIWSESWF